MPDITSQEFADRVNAIQLKIAAILEVEFAADKVRIWPRWVTDAKQDRTEWGRLLWNDEEHIRAITIEFAGLENPPVNELPAGDIAPMPTFVIDFYEGFELGNDSVNSSRRVKDLFNRALFALAGKTDLDMRDFVKRHNHLSAPPEADVLPFGDCGLANWIPGSLTVLMQNVYAR